MKKRLLTLFLAICMICTLLPFSAFAEDEEAPTSGTCGKNATWTYKDCVLTISGTGAMTSTPWRNCSYYKDISKIIIKKGITSIGEDAFSYCGSLTSITIANSVRSIGNYAFDGCSSLTSVTIPNSVTSIGEFAFYDCGRLSSVTIPNNVTRIGAGAFIGCDNLTEMHYNAKAAKVVSCPGYDYVFSAEDNKKYANITIGNGVESIPDSMFAYCSIKEITIPNSVKSIGSKAFSYCSSLKEITIPNSVKSIGSEAFSYCSSLKEITISDSVKSIEWGAFHDCHSLTKVSILGKLTSIENVTFQNCTSLKEINIPESVTSIGGWAFQNCTSLTKMTIPNKVKSIKTYVFSGCDKLKSVTIPYSVKSIEDSAFADCKNLTDIYYLEAETQWNKIKIGANGCEYLLDAKMHYSDHTWDSGKITKAASCTANGVKTYTCKVCGETKTELIPALSHNYKNGKCTVCGAKDPNYKPVTKNPFVDVKKADYYYDPILWAYYHDPQITTGVDKTHFAPNNNCTRGQIVTFLWRAKGCPEVKGIKNPFKDVKSSDYYYKAVLWAVSEKITKGVDDTHFAPDQTCTRAQSVTFMWRAEGQHGVKDVKNPFKDVKTSDYYYNAVLWALGKNITNGVDNTHFAPNNTCTRGQIVTFLYRDRG